MLGERLERFADRSPLVLGLPRGGVPVASEVARCLGAPLDVILVRKLGVPSQPELAMGAIGEGGVRVMNEEVVRLARVRQSEIDAVEAREAAELERRSQQLRGDRPRVPYTGRNAIVVDDGIATGATARAALSVVRHSDPESVTLAVPVAPPDTVEAMRHVADDVVCLLTPDYFSAVGAWYKDFRPVSDDEVVELLRDHPSDVM